MCAGLWGGKQWSAPFSTTSSALYLQSVDWLQVTFNEACLFSLTSSLKLASQLFIIILQRKGQTGGCGSRTESQASQKRRFKNIHPPKPSRSPGPENKSLAFELSALRPLSFCGSASPPKPLCARFFFLFAVPHSMWDLSFPTRAWIYTSCIGSVES